MQWVKYEREGAVATITMNRAERLNAWGKEISQEIGEAFQLYKDDDEARVAILCGAGKSFCAGGDAMGYKERQSPWTTFPHNEMGVLGRGELFKPVIGAIQGHCLGAGLLLLAFRCDIRIAADNAQFGLPEVGVGIINCMVASANQGLPLCVLMEMAMTTDPIDARRALELGMINKVVSPDSLMAEARRVAERVAANSPEAVRWTKQNLLKAVEVSREAKMLEKELYGQSSRSHGAIAGFSALADHAKLKW